MLLVTSFSSIVYYFIVLLFRDILETLHGPINADREAQHIKRQACLTWDLPIQAASERIQ